MLIESCLESLERVIVWHDLSVEGGCIVKEWDFEAETNQNELKKYIQLFMSYVHGVSLHKTDYREPLMKSQCRNFPTSCHTITHVRKP